MRAERTLRQLVTVTALQTLPFAFGLVCSAFYRYVPYPGWLYGWLWISYGAFFLGQVQAWWIPYHHSVAARTPQERHAEHAAFDPASHDDRNARAAPVRTAVAALLCTSFLIRSIASNLWLALVVPLLPLAMFISGFSRWRSILRDKRVSHQSLALSRSRSEPRSCLFRMLGFFGGIRGASNTITLPGKPSSCKARSEEIVRIEVRTS